MKLREIEFTQKGLISKVLLLQLSGVIGNGEGGLLLMSWEIRHFLTFKKYL